MASLNRLGRSFRGRRLRDPLFPEAIWEPTDPTLLVFPEAMPGAYLRNAEFPEPPGSAPQGALLCAVG
jgi:hypothetical protein